MEKPNLYYIVLVGTNDRVQTGDKLPLIVRYASIDDVLDKCKELAKPEGFSSNEYEAITIEEYERIFTEPEEW